MMLSKRRVKTQCTRQDNARYSAALYVNTMPEKRHAYTLCIYIRRNDAVKVARVYIVYTLNTEWHVYTYTLRMYILYVYIDDAEEEACVCIVYTSKRCLGRGIFICVMATSSKRQIKFFMFVCLFVCLKEYRSKLKLRKFLGGFSNNDVNW